MPTAQRIFSTQCKNDKIKNKIHATIKKSNSDNNQGHSRNTSYKQLICIKISPIDTQGKRQPLSESLKVA